MQQEEIAINVQNLSKTYKLYNDPTDRLKESLSPFKKIYHTEFHALQNVSFTIKKGECLAIIGKNGSGKSTLLKIITGIIQPTAGRVAVYGKIAALLELGAGFNPELTGMENIYLNGTILGFSKREVEEKLLRILEFADIGDFIYQPVKMYSSGMFARLAFALAINVDPDILIVDEALSVGDVAFQTKCYRKFNEFRQNGKTILFVTHATDTVLKFCSKAIVLNDGQKIAEGSSKEMVDVYKKLIVNSTKSSYSDNLLHSKLTTAGEWKQQFKINPSMLEYGTKEAEIIDYGIFNENGDPVTSLLHNDSAVIKMKIRFNENLSDVIFALSVKDIKGNELAGTNTMYEDIDAGLCRIGDIITVTFTQMINLQNGNYTISLGCTAFSDDKLTVYHRLYDVLIFQVVAFKHFVGVFDIQSQVEITKADDNDEQE
jgi:teichoic acid transport system ATP-binding protein